MASGVGGAAAGACFAGAPFASALAGLVKEEQFNSGSWFSSAE